MEDHMTARASRAATRDHSLAAGEASLDGGGALDGIGEIVAELRLHARRIDRNDGNPARAELLRQAARVIDYLAAQTCWLDISSAPKDGTVILTWDGRSVSTAFWGRVGHLANRLAWVGGHCKIDHIDQPTHWMLTPPAPP